MSNSKQVLIGRYFKEGSEIEISSTDQGLVGTWYLGTIIRVKPKSYEAIVEYKTLRDEKDERLPLREEIGLIHVRPPQPAEEIRKFNVNDVVDAYYHDGWWEGIVTGFMDAEPEDKYVVFFKHTRERRAFKGYRLRIHREWVYGNWHPALDKEVSVKSPEIEVPARNKCETRSRDEMSTPLKVAVKTPEIEMLAFKKHKIRSQDEFTPSEDVPSIHQMQRVPLSAEIPVSTESTPNKEQANHDFRPGQLVEVSQDGEGFEGAWFSAAVVQTLNADKYVIEYQDLLCEDNKIPLTEEVDSQHLRPCPPEVSIVDRYSVLEYVDAFCDDCWWTGVISKVLKDDRYYVYFSSFDKEMKFKHSQLRVHQKWINHRWIIPTKASKLR